MIWSEPPFIALVVIAMIVALKPVSASKLILLVVLFTALFFVRYVGPVFAASIALSAAWFDRQKLGLIKSALMNFAILLVSLIPVWYWLQRNESIDGTLTGARTPAGGSLLNPLKTFTATLGSLVTASPVEGGIYLSWNEYPNNTKTLGILILIAVAILLIIYFLPQSRAEKLESSSNVLLLSGSTALIYIAFSAYRFVHFELGPLDNRMMIPIFVPLVLVVALLADRIKVSSQSLRKVAISIFLMFLGFQALSGVADALRFGRDGRYWAAKEFQAQPIHKFVKNLPTDSSLMSNQPQQLFAVWQKSSVFNQYQLELAQTAECTHRYFVWYNSTYDDGTLNVEGQPEGATEIYSDASGVVLDLGTCDSDITAFWP
jgi:general stress protein CsbA